MEAAITRQMYPEGASEAVRVLIADDQPQILEALQLLLKNCGFSTQAVNDPARLLRALEQDSFDAVLLDLNYTRDTTAGQEGLELISQIRARDKLLPVLAMTAWGSIDQAVEAMRRGASDFVQKPWENRQLLQKLQDQVSRAQGQRRVQSQQDEELRAAREIQDKLLPKQLPELAEYEIAAMTQPLQFVGGDYYNVGRLSLHHTVLCMADVAGKGMPAALLMSSLQAALRPLINQKLTPREVCQQLNRILCDLTPLGKFISFFYAVLDSRDKQLTYCNAGHNPPLLIRADGRSTELNAGGTVLGQFPDWRYEQSHVQIGSADTLLLFTDGLVEACNADQEWFGEQNLIRIVLENGSSSARDLMGLIIGAASEHCGETFQDDASLIVLKGT
jgi:sigma-B regulation protein RsbU (phosphoserine phosphatase)